MIHPTTSGRRRLLSLPLVLVALVPALRAALAHAGPRLEVHGASHFEATTNPTHGLVAVSGSLLDDADRPIADAAIHVAFVAEGGAFLDARPCNPGHAFVPENQAWGVTTEADGTFCARADARPGKTLVTLAWAGSRFFTGTHVELAVDASRRAVTLAFDPEPRVIALGEGALVVDAVAAFAGEDDAVATGLALRLTDERGAALGQATTDGVGRARFVVPPGDLGPAGPGELRVTFDGDPHDAEARHVVAGERRAEVRVTALPTKEAASKAVTATLEEHGAAIDLEVRTTTGDAVPTGSVEGLYEGAVIGAANVTAGRAHLVARWPARVMEGGSTTLDARYVADAPWYVAGPKVTLAVTVPRVPLWRRAFVLAAGVALLVAFVLSRSRLRLALPAPVGPSAGLARLTSDLAGVQVVAPQADAARGWEGRVVDAQDRHGLAEVVVTIERSSFEGTATLARVTTDASGSFVLPALAVRPGDQLTAEGKLHGRWVGTAPSPSVVEVALVSRRRGVIRRFVEWTRKRGAPFDARPEPTPAYVRRIAGEDAPTARWAGAVEEAAFGDRIVDAELEAEVERLGHEKDAPR